METIATAIQEGLKHLDRIVASQALQKYQNEVVPDLWFNELGRLRVWTANLGAHQTGQFSLEFRLREASHLKDQTMRALGRLQRTIQDLEDLLHGTGYDQEYSSDSDESEKESQTMIQSVYLALHDTISILFENAMAIRRPALHDMRVGLKRSDTAEFEPCDRKHVADKFPSLDREISDRLGLAITQRRATLKYREQRHLKLARGLSETVPMDLDVKPTEDDSDLQSRISQTSYAESMANRQDGMGIPPPPKESLSGDPFQCPYCFLLIKISGRQSWTQHVLRDLMPYICVFPHCRIPYQLYETRREWYAHLQNEHSVPEEADNSISCSLCSISVGSATVFRRHLARHLQELALFALPRSEPDEGLETLSCEWRGCSDDSIFKSEPDLWAHLMRQHIRPKVLKCHLCEYTTDRHDMKAHMLAVHKEENEQQQGEDQTRYEPIECEWGSCHGPLFAHRSSLTRHVRNHVWMVETRSKTPREFKSEVKNTPESMKYHNYATGQDLFGCMIAGETMTPSGFLDLLNSPKRP